MDRYNLKSNKLYQRSVLRGIPPLTDDIWAPLNTERKLYQRLPTCHTATKHKCLFAVLFYHSIKNLLLHWLAQIKILC